jgi:hypothetical protein
VLAAVRELNRIELVAETLRAALNAIAVLAPVWLKRLAGPDWHRRYDHRVEAGRLPPSGPKRDAYGAQVGADGFRLLDGLTAPGAPPEAAALPAVALLRRVWDRHFERLGEGGGSDPGAPAQVRLRAVPGRGPGDPVESPSEAKARFRAKSGTEWTGYMVHFTETCDAGAPRLLRHADPPPANVHEALRTEAIHAALAAKGLVPAEPLACAYVSAKHLVAARERHGIDPIGPARPVQTWQAKANGALLVTDVAGDGERRCVRRPEGRDSTGWGESRSRMSGRPSIRASFSPADGQPCLARADAREVGAVA